MPEGKSGYPTVPLRWITSAPTLSLPKRSPRTRERENMGQKGLSMANGWTHNKLADLSVTVWFLLVPQSNMLEHGCIRLSLHTAQVQGAVGKGVTRRTSPERVC